MFEKCTKTSSPSAWLMKPKPFSALKNLTVPVGIAVPLVSGWCIGLSGANVATGTDETTRTESNCERETPSTKAVTVAHRRKDASAGVAGLPPATPSSRNGHCWIRLPFTVVAFAALQSNVPFLVGYLRTHLPPLNCTTMKQDV